ncbi:hydrolase [Actinoplanes sp. NPDC051859]|uniref:hydrolase n=1 Tax=Actinoplanes sp. NPDC051859 TaxID=3363909 RepID=UPI0037B65F33
MNDLVLPAHATGVVVLLAGPHDRELAAELHRRDLGTVGVSAPEPGAGPLADQVIELVDWLGEHGPTADLEIGLFGETTGSAAALLAAAARPDSVRAVVATGGRPELAGPALPDVSAPTLLLVPDEQAVDRHRQACATMTVTAQLRVVADTAVAEQASAWFDSYLEPRGNR